MTRHNAGSSAKSHVSYPSPQSGTRRLHQKKRDVGEKEGFIFDGFTDDDFAEQLGELTVESATCAEDRLLTAFDDNAPEDMVSPFGVADDVDEDEPEL